MIHTANEFTKTHHRHLLSGISPGLHALPAGCLTEPTAAPSRSTRAATAAAHQSGASGTSASASPAPSSPADGQSPSRGGPEQGSGYGAVDQGFRRPSTTENGQGVAYSRGMLYSGSASLIDVHPVQGNPADSLMVRLAHSHSQQSVSYMLCVVLSATVETWRNGMLQQSDESDLEMSSIHLM